MPLHVVMYSRPNCCLCDAAESMLQSLRGEFEFTFEKVNIDNDSALARYNCQIPVLLFNGKHRVALRVSIERLRRSLNRAQNSLVVGEGFVEA